ncbi:MAG: DUF3307 domain-containing protein [Patescibacteria group bacterium]|nr:DUF3307 domain-containing protein [Patescibacteria group bacterium]
MIGCSLILGHLVTDFLLQPTKLANWKQKSNIGMFLHAFILFAISGGLLFPYWDQALMWQFAAILAASHFIQDKIKVWYELNYNKKRASYPFFIDQFIHLTVIFLIAKYLFWHLEPPTVSFNFSIYIYASLLILFSFALDIAVFQIKRHRNPNLKYKRDYDPITKRVLAFSVFYVVFLILSSQL